VATTGTTHQPTAIGFSLAAFAAGLTVPALASAAEPDAELIAFAATLRENNAKLRKLQALDACTQMGLTCLWTNVVTRQSLKAAICPPRRWPDCAPRRQ
jgi:hypothetical protein